MLNTGIAFTLRTKAQITTFTSADGTNFKKIFDNSPEGSRITAIWATSDAGASYNFTLDILQDGVQGGMTAGQIPMGSGRTAGVPTASLLNRSWMPNMNIDSDGNPFFDFMSGEQLYLKMQTAIASGTITIVVTYGMYDAEDAGLMSVE